MFSALEKVALPPCPYIRCVFLSEAFLAIRATLGLRPTVFRRRSG